MCFGLKNCILLKTDTALKFPLSKYGLLLFGFYFMVTGLVGQVYYKGKNFSKEDGLSDNRVTCFYKDKTGFMWVGTKNGLNRFDGHSFKLYKPGSGNSISNEVINDIAGDRDGKIWVATMRGLNIFDPVNDRWEVIVPAAQKTKNDIPNQVVWDIWFDAKGLLWIASDVFEFASYDQYTKKFTLYDWPSFAKKELALPGTGSYNSIQRFTFFNQYECWLGTTKGLVSLNTLTGVFTFHGGGYYADVLDLRYEEQTGKVYLSVQNGKLFCYDSRSKSYKQLSPVPESYPSESFLLDNGKELWMPSDKGLLKIDPLSDKVKLGYDKLPLKDVLLHGGVNHVYVDENGISWIGTNRGIHLEDKFHVSSVFIPLSASSPTNGINNVAGVFFDEELEQYFISFSDPAVVFVINRRSGTIKKIDRDITGRPFDPCNKVKKDRAGNTWLLTQCNVYKYNPATTSFTLFPMPNKGSAAVYRDVAMDKDGNLWFATFNEGLYLYNSSGKIFDTLVKKNGFPKTVASCLYADDKNPEVWIGTYGLDLYRYDLVSKKLTSYHETEIARQYVSLNLINDITADNAGTIWVATNTGGIFRFNRNEPYDKAFTKFDMRSGLNNNSILSLVADKNNFVWLLSGAGVSVVSPAGFPVLEDMSEKLFEFAAYGSDISIPHHIAYNSKHNEILTGVGGGLHIYYPYRYSKPASFPMVYTFIRTDNKESIPLYVNDKPLLKLPARSKLLEIEFAALYYGAASGIRYEYKLKGYDEEWMRGDNKFTATYQNLPSGSYNFMARAMDEQGNVVSSIKEMTFILPAALWQRWWFIGLIISLAIIAVGLIINSLKRKLKEEEQLKAFATSLYGKSTVDDILWDTAQNCIALLGFEDCVIYLKDDNKDVVVQIAAAGPKSPANSREIINRLEIPLGKGIVGTVAKTGIPELIGNTAKDSRYIVDDEPRLSEITVPVIIEDNVFAVIDAEHSKKKYFKKHHLKLLQKIAAICAERIAKYLAEEKLRTKIARDLHDEMGSTLTSINILSKVGMESGEISEQVRGYLQKIKDNSGRMMESMSDIVWAINPANDTLEKVLIRMKEFAAELLEPARINYFFDIEGVLEDISLNLEQRKDLYMIFKESVNNAVKYSGATEMSFLIEHKPGMLRMVITDNGAGFDSAAEQTGNGLKNIASRAAAMNAIVQIKSIPGTGTSIVLEKTVTS